MGNSHLIFVDRGNSRLYNQAAMERAFLLAGSSSRLSSALTKRLLEHGARVLAARPGGQADEEGAVAWMRHSPLSARTVVSTAVNRFGSLSDVLILVEAAESQTPYHRVGSAEVEERVDVVLKGALYLAREALGQMIQLGAGTLSLVLCEQARTRSTALESGLAGATVEFGEALFQEYRDEGPVVRGFRAVAAEADEFARLVAEEILSDGRKSRGKWLVHGRRQLSGIFKTR